MDASIFYSYTLEYADCIKSFFFCLYFKEDICCLWQASWLVLYGFISELFSVSTVSASLIVSNPNKLMLFLRVAYYSIYIFVFALFATSFGQSIIGHFNGGVRITTTDLIWAFAINLPVSAFLNVI